MTAYMFDDGIPRFARGLSREIFGGRGEPPIVFQVSLESMRADDIHALEPSAPAEIAELRETGIA